MHIIEENSENMKESEMKWKQGKQRVVGITVVEGWTGWARL